MLQLKMSCSLTHGYFDLNLFVKAAMCEMKVHQISEAHTTAVLYIENSFNILN